MENHVKDSKRNGGISVKKEDFMKRLRFVMVCALIMLVSVALIGCTNSADPPQNATEDFQSAGTPPDVLASDNASFSSQPMPNPKTMTIEKIGLKDVEVIPVTADANTHMPTPPGAKGVTWFKDGPSPGWDYNAIISGHNYFNGEEGTFARLRELEEGDKVEFKYEDDSIGYFEVFHKERYPEDGCPDSTMENKPPARTTLITCDGERKEGGGYPYRIIFHLSAMKHVDKDGNALKLYVPVESNKDDGKDKKAE